MEFDLRATWLVVGHLFLERCPANGATRHPEIVRPNHAWSRGDWFAHDPGGDEADAPLFFARSLVQSIRACRGAPGDRRALLLPRHLRRRRLLAGRGRERSRRLRGRGRGRWACAPTSFSFPRNRVGHEDALAPRGFRTFRTPEPALVLDERSGPLVRRLGHLADVLLAREPPVVLPRRRPDGLIEVPGSMIYFPMHGLRRFLPVSLRVRRAQKGLRAAVRQGRVFHLWTHPTNLADRTESMFGGLRRILEDVADLRSRDLMEVRTLGELVPPGPEAPWPS